MMLFSRIPVQTLIDHCLEILGFFANEDFDRNNNDNYDNNHKGE